MHSKKSPGAIVFAWLFTVAVVVLGYVLLGWLPALLFAFGFVGGFMQWLIVPTKAGFDRIRWAYFVTLALFVVHKFEERQMDFFPALAKITGVPVPDTNSVFVVLLYAFAAAWLLVPILMSRDHPFGQYLAWTFFTSMGVTELAHFVFPLLVGSGYGYFPGMASVVVLAPAAWWGLNRLGGWDALTKR